jgi:hypothetical protein
MNQEPATAETAWDAAREAQRRFLAHTPLCIACPTPGDRCTTRQGLWREYQRLYEEATA